MKTRLKAFAELLWDLYQQKNPHATIEISNYHKKYLGKSSEEIFEAQLSFPDILHTIKQEYGFAPTVNINIPAFTETDFLFEEAVDLMLCAGMDEWNHFLQAQPHIISQRSLYGHHASLLNYCGNNGVEIWRQFVPLNLMEKIQSLLRMGARKEDRMKVYGGEFTTLELFNTSAHPYDAEIDRVGIQKLLASAPNLLDEENI